jgi:hypothetical protein
MDSLLAALPALGCLVMMPAMAWVMARGMPKHDSPDPARQQPLTEGPARDDEVTQLRDEVARLRADLDGEAHSSESTGG